MKLESIKYVENDGTPNEWRLHELMLGPVNLIVGKNATGKSRAVNVISGLAKLISGRLTEPFNSGFFDARFDDEGSKTHYVLHCDKGQIPLETLTIDGKVMLERRGGEVGKLHYSKQGQWLDFQPPAAEVAVASRRDALQQPYLQPLQQWGDSLLHFQFGTPLGKDNLAVFVKDGPPVDFSDPSKVVGIFKHAVKQLNGAFIEAIKQDMRAIGYAISDVQLATATNVQTPFPAEVQALVVKEDDLPGMTDQINMSQGMFRALSILIQLNYAALARVPSCILIDDIGEGLDFDRSSALIKLLVDRANGTSVQLIMTTNDRFVMNNVPLDAWSVLHRTPEGVQVFNIRNSKERFDKFEYTGLSNFDFFATDFVTEEADAE